MTIATRFYTWLRGKLVGSDQFGNRYYREKDPTGRAPWRREKRWVVYKGEAEASAVPAEWHGWLHYTTDAPPSADHPRRPWQKEHLPNLTGTSKAYRPPGHEFSGGRRAPATGDYEPWTPS